MANPFQQQSLRRKLIYFGLIVALFTVSLLHRKLVINAEARRLKLREVEMGEVALTDTAIRLSLSGMRGLAVTSLWLSAIERQKRHEWSELEVLVNSLTKLQPRYVSPWLFQSWNLAFNVSVECDRSRDKYFYISRGIDLLAEGERKNRGTEEEDDPELRTPGHPDMRYYVGFTYQLKIGQGDEKRTLRCLFDLSCIDPKQRDPESLWRVGAAGKEVDLEKFLHFCKDNPRLVRRLREQLGYESPRDIVGFLADNREVPSRFKPPDDPSNQRLKPPIEQFPCLPITPRRSRDWPDPTQDNFGRSGNDQDVDVFEVTRAWYEFAQDPLPPENAQWGLENEPNAIPGRHRLPRMSQYIFRTYPARAQAYVAEEMEKEGWFDGEGWTVTGWFDDLPRVGEQDVVVGKSDRFNARLAWKKSLDQYLDYGNKNALPEPREYLKLYERALGGGERSKAFRQLQWVDQTIRMTAFHDFVHQTQAESHRSTVAARRKLYEADRKRNKDEDRAVVLYQENMDEWIDVLLKFPGFARLSHVQEDLYEPQLFYLRLLREKHKRRLEPLLLAVSTLGPPAPLTGVPGLAIHPLTRLTHLLDEETRQGYIERVAGLNQAALCLRPGVLPLEAAALAWLTPPSGRSGRPTEQRVKRNILMRNIAGPLDMAFLYAGPVPFEPVQDRWLLDEAGKEAFMTQVVTLNQALLSLRPGVLPLEQVVMGRLSPELPDETRQLERYRNRLLLLTALRDYSPGGLWRPLITDSAIQQVRERLGVNRVPQQTPAEPPAEAPAVPRPKQP